MHTGEIECCVTPMVTGTINSDYYGRTPIGSGDVNEPGLLKIDEHKRKHNCGLKERCREQTMCVSCGDVEATL